MLFYDCLTPYKIKGLKCQKIQTFQLFIYNCKEKLININLLQVTEEKETQKLKWQK
jgi:hypothetical protein